MVQICDHGSPKFWDRPQNQIPGGSFEVSVKWVARTGSSFVVLIYFGQKLGLGGGSPILKNKEEPKVINKIEYLPNMVGDHLTMDGIVNP